MLGLIAIDVDGTLVGTGNVVRDDVWQALAGARAAGVRLAVCSGRPAFGNALAYARRLDSDGWHVFQNGASIVKVDTGESLSEPFPADKLQAMIELSHARKWLLEVYTDTDMAVTIPGEISQRHAALLGIPYDPKDPSALSGTVVRVQWVVPYAQSDEVMAVPHAGLDLHPASSPVMTDVNFISVTQAGVSKGTAIRVIARKYGLDMGRVMAVGDGENDLHALAAVGHPVAMGNSPQLVKDAAEYVVGDVDDGGLCDAVALALRL